MATAMTDYCEECERQTELLHHSDGSAVCADCGVVAWEDRIDDARDVRIFEDNTDARRVEEAAPANPSSSFTAGATTDGLLPTFIQGKSRGTGPDAARLRHLGRAAYSSSSSSGSSSAPAYAERTRSWQQILSAYAVALNLPEQACERAQALMQAQISQKGKVSMRGKNQRALLAACLYHAASALELPRSLHELALASRIPKKHISHARKLILRHNPKQQQQTQEAISAAAAAEEARAPAVKNLVKVEAGRVCAMLQLAYADRLCVEGMAEAAQRRLDIRKAPNSQAAALVWIFMTLNPPMHERLKTAFLSLISVSLNTLRQTYALFVPHIHLILPSERFGSPQQWQPLLRRP